MKKKRTIQGQNKNKTAPQKKKCGKCRNLTQEYEDEISCSGVQILCIWTVKHARQAEYEFASNLFPFINTERT